ncbi:hypothetical protein BBJ28_00002387 [Nothophytophthora sp. Chile5]|nr:hypothetical protein BBJ28_00002387 [Nothophytophthora sp. Chile5]
MIGRDCTTSTGKEVKYAYGDSDYVLVEEFVSGDDDCSTYNSGAEAFAVGSCVATPNTTYESAQIAHDTEGAWYIYRYSDEACGTKELTVSATSDGILGHSCVSDGTSVYKFYTTDEYTAGSWTYSGDGSAESDATSSTTSTASSGAGSEAASASAAATDASTTSGDTSSAGTTSGGTTTNSGTVSSSESTTSSDTTASSGNADASSSSSGAAVSTTDANSSSGLSTGALIGIIIGAVVVVACVAGLIFWWGRRSANKAKSLESPVVLGHNGRGRADDRYVNMMAATAMSGDTNTQTNSSRMERNDQYFSSKPRGVGANQMGLGDASLWNDETLLASRIPREKVLVQQLISRGGYGEVYAGTYKEARVAVKMLLPETRKSAAHITDFLTEVKLMARLDHPCIVHFVGVAWDSPNDLCAVTEFMEGGDLRGLLSEYLEQDQPIGFTHQKVKIALHVAHALTYLHSLAPPVIHRDLKSKSILLNAELDAKLTDFGVSRERVDRTMTAAVGTSLWMAPEIMMGERYDDKADIFSFGVVLSELNSHTLPYVRAKARDGSGKRMPDTAILQLVATGKLRVDFTQGSPESLMRLGSACVSVDPKDRPTAAEVLYALQTVLAKEAL